MIRTTLICETPDLNKVLPRNILVKDRKTFCLLHMRMGSCRQIARGYMHESTTLYGDIFQYVYRKAKDRQEFTPPINFSPTNMGRYHPVCAYFWSQFGKFKEQEPNIVVYEK